MAVRISPLRLRFPSFLVTASGSQEAATPCCGSGGGGGGGGLTARAMSSAPSPYTTLKERVSCEREIKKSKFLAVAAPISDERSAHSFLSEVLSSPLPSSRFDSTYRSPTHAERLGFDYSSIDYLQRKMISSRHIHWVFFWSAEKKNQIFYVLSSNRNILLFF